MRTWSVSVSALIAVAVLAGLTLAGGGTTPPTAAKPVTTTQAAGDTVTLDVKTFKLEDAQVKDCAGATGGKAVLFDKETASAKSTVTLKKGTYEVTLFMKAEDDAHDAVYLTVAGQEERLFPEDYGKVMAATPFTVEVKADGAVPVALTAAETGMFLDKIVLKKVK